MNKARQDLYLTNALRLLVERCPRLTSTCYWAETSPIALEVLHHRTSFDLDFHTCDALVDVRPVLAEIQKVFADSFQLLQPPDAYGSGFTGLLKIDEQTQVTIEVLSNFTDVVDSDLEPSTLAPQINRVSISRYLADKVQCVSERMEARDLSDIAALLKKNPEISNTLKDLLEKQDLIFMAERLLSWSDDGIKKDLLAYDDVDFNDAITSRDMLLTMIKEMGHGKEEIS